MISNIFKPYLFHRFLAFVLATLGGLLIGSVAYAAPTTSSNYKGDTFSHIGPDYGISIKDLTDYNLLNEPDYIRVSQPLYTPSSSLHSESGNPFHLINIREQKDAANIDYPEVLFSQSGSERGDVTIEHRLHSELTEEFKLGNMIIHKLGDSEKFSSPRFEDCSSLDGQQNELAFTNFDYVSIFAGRADPIDPDYPFGPTGPCTACSEGRINCRICWYWYGCSCNKSFQQSEEVW